MNQRYLFNKGWSFLKTDLNVEKLPDQGYQPVEIPHDWLIYDVSQLYEDSIGWYKKTLTLEEVKPHTSLYFEGVYMDSTLYVNSREVGQWKNGYASFEHEISHYLNKGENEIVLKVVHQSPNSRWYSGAGIYRDVYLLERGPSHLASFGTYVSVRKGSPWQLEVETSVINGEGMTLRHELSRNEEKLTCATLVKNNTTTQVLSIEKPELWSPDSPTLYTLDTYLEDEGVIIDQWQEKVGFKDVKMDSQQGFSIEGKQAKLNGVCEHHDLGALGAAFNGSALKERLHTLKAMGVNAIRTAHNMPAKALMDLCDEMGFFVVSEAFDMWERPKTPYDHARFFNEWAERDVASWVRRDRNHVSLLMWSIGNEIYDTHASEKGLEITKRLKRFVLKHDPKENAPVTIGSNFMPWENAQKCAEEVTYAGYNYAEKYYEPHHKAHPDWIIYGSETASVVQSRGIYHFPYEKSILSDDNEQCSALGNSTTSWGAKSPEFCIAFERDCAFSLGQFLWTGFDYIGEPTPYHTKNAYFGQVDTAGFVKDPYYIYQSNWTDVANQPMIHLFPYWDFNPGQTIDVRVASNAPHVELFLNETSLGKRDIDHKHGPADQLVPTFKVPYEPGELKAVAYDKEGQVIATTSAHSFQDPVKLKVDMTKEALETGGKDLAYLTVTAVDEQGREVRNAVNRVQVDISGAGRLIGLDNGDSTDTDAYKGTSKRLFSGKCRAIISTKDMPGEISVRVTSKGLEPAEATLFATGEAIEAPWHYDENKNMPIVLGAKEEIPTRKIELESLSGQVFTKDKSSLEVSVVLYPKDATDQEITYSVVTDEGVTSNLAVCEETATGIRLTAKGDGPFRLRATNKSNTDKVRVISELDFIAEGLGIAYKNPYELIAGGLYDISVGDVSSGNERGFATSRDSKTIVGFKDIDFREVGSNQITCPIFTLSDKAYSLKIYDGDPQLEETTCLANVIYEKPSIWNVYQEETYRLNKRLTGISDLYFETEEKMHVKGFYFEPYNPAGVEINAEDADKIYGDSFHVANGMVKGIGNNVSLMFKHFDFKEGMDTLMIKGHSPIEKNTIHVHFEDEAGETAKQMIEFEETEHVTEKIFKLETIKGKQTVTFIFLPGSHFDFYRFKFC